MPTIPRPTLSTKSSATTLAYKSAEDVDIKTCFEQKLVETRSWRIKRFLLFSLPLVVAATLAVSTLRTLTDSYSSGASWGCDAAGKVWVLGIEASMWSLDTALSPTLPVFRAKFSTVKAIDICWDLVVGHGYRGLCIIVVYNVFRTVMVDIMRHDCLGREEMLAMEYSPASIWSGLVHTKSFLQQCRTHSKSRKFSICWTALLLIIATAYSLAAPTWLAAMTSYQSVMRPLLPTEHGLVTFDQIEQECAFRIVDGSRIGLEDNICIKAESSWTGEIEQYLSQNPGSKCYPGNSVYSLDPHHREDCNWSSVFVLPNATNVYLGSPVLKIHGGLYTYNNHSISGAHLAKVGMCQPEKDQYEWGFSFVLLFGFMVPTILVASCVSFTWYVYQQRLWHQQVNIMFGTIRTALVVAASVKEGVGDGMYEMTEEELNSALASSVGVGTIHAGSDIMFRPGPLEKRRSKFRYDLPIGSNSYKAYLREGLGSIK